MADQYLDERSYEIGDVIFAEGDTGHEMFIIQTGKVAVTKKIGGAEVLLATLERGDFFGEMALLESQPRQATCRALVPTRLVAVRSGELLLKLRRDPTFAVEMLQTMSRRIRYLDEQVTRLMEQRLMSREEFDELVAKSEYRKREDSA